jgi:hypothetical protein
MSEQNLRADDLDRLGQALVTLAQELWVVKDRQKVLEAALAEAGVIVQDSIDQFQPDATLASQLKTDRAELIESVLGALTRK